MDEDKSPANPHAECFEAIDYLSELLAWAYGRCVSFGLENSANHDTVLRMDEIKLCLTNMQARSTTSADEKP